MPSQDQNCFESDTSDRQRWLILQALLSIAPEGSPLQVIGTVPDPSSNLPILLVGGYSDDIPGPIGLRLDENFFLKVTDEMAHAALDAINGKLPTFALGAGNVNAQTIRVVLPFDQADVPVKTPKGGTSNTPSILSAAGALAANTARKSWSIQNLGTNPLFVRMSGTAASTTVFHRVLRAGTTNDDGTGGIFEDDVWTGAVQIAGTSPRYTVTEITA